MKLLSQTGLNKPKLAFTVIDAVVGMGVFGIVLLSLFASFTLGFGVVRLSQEELRATQILQEKMEVIRLYKWDQLTNSGFIPASFNEALVTGGSNFFKGTIEINNATFTNAPAYSADLREVKVSLSWTNIIRGTNFVKRSRDARTFVSHYGLQNYVP